MVVIAFWVKNFFIAIAVIFLIIGVLTLFFSEMDANAAKKWRNNIIWTTIGIIIMQMAYSVWSSLILTSSNASTGISAALAWDFWASTIAPIIGIINLIAGFAFVAMMFYAFYIIITSAGDESGRKK